MAEKEKTTAEQENTETQAQQAEETEVQQEKTAEKTELEKLQDESPAAFFVEKSTVKKSRALRLFCVR